MSIDASVDGRAANAARSATRLGLESVRRGLARARTGIYRALARPTASDVAAALLALVATVAAGSTLVGLRLAVLATAAGAVAALVAVLLASTNPAVRAVGGVVAVPAAVLVATPSTLGWGFALGIGGFGLVAAAALWALVLVGLSAPLVSWAKLGDGGLRRGATGTMLVTGGVVGVVAATILPAADVRDRAVTAAADVATEATDLLVHPDPERTLVTFFALVAVAGFLAGRTIGYLPLERLVPPDRRDGLATAIRRIRRALSLSIRVSIVGAAAVFATGALETGIETTPAALARQVPAPIGEYVATLVTTPGVRLGLLAVGAVALGLALAERGRRALRRGLAGVLARVFAPVVGGAVVAIGVARATADPALNAALVSILDVYAPDSVLLLVEAVPAFAVAALVLVLALGSLSSTLFSVSWLRTIRILPPRAIGAAIAAAATFALAVVLGLLGRIEGSVWTGVAAFVVWDVGEYGEDLRRDLGRDARTLRAELVHASGSLVTGLVVGGGTIALYRRVILEGPAIDARLAAVAVVAGVVTTVLVAWTLRT